MPTQPIRPTRPISADAAAAALLLVAAVGVAIAVAGRPALLAPVVTSAGDTVFTIATVNLGTAVIVPLVLGAVTHVLAARPASRESTWFAPVRWFERTLSASITLFLLAQLNGIRELGALVAIYALTSAWVLFGVLQERDSSASRDGAASHDGTASRRPAVFGAMVGIVPWGLIAWYQIAPTLAVALGVTADAVAGPSLWVRVLTVALLVLVAAAVVSAWRRASATRITLALGVLTRLTLACGVAAAVVGGLAL